GGGLAWRMGAGGHDGRRAWHQRALHTLGIRRARQHPRPRPRLKNARARDQPKDHRLQTGNRKKLEKVEARGWGCGLRVLGCGFWVLGTDSTAMTNDQFPMTNAPASIGHW